MPGLVCKEGQHSVFAVDLDQCAYGLKLRDTDGKIGPCKKTTKIIGNAPFLKALERRCACTCAHVHVQGGVRTPSGWRTRSELAGHYPLRLCNKYASAALRFCQEMNI